MKQFPSKERIRHGITPAAFVEFWWWVIVFAVLAASHFTLEWFM
ncbi:hypothetical protein [Luteolibacter marinus]|nr:hypothetical protein [Luteolibacter marinus]